MTTETPETRFERVLGPRLRDVLQGLKLIGNLAGREYDWPGRAARAQAVFAEISAATAASATRLGVQPEVKPVADESAAPHRAAPTTTPAHAGKNGQPVIATHDGIVIGHLATAVRRHGVEAVRAALDWVERREADNGQP